MTNASHKCISGWLAALGAACALLAPRAASADDVPATGKGITGAALLGGEVVMLGEAAFGLKNGWGYVIGGVVGIGAGAYLGYVAEKNADPKVSVYLLAGGMALVIPTTVAVLQATSYSPPEDYTEDRPPPGAPVPEPIQQPGAPSAAPPQAGAPAQRTLSLHYHWSQPTLRITPGLVSAENGLRLSVPAVEVRPLSQGPELRVALFSATF